MYRLITPQEIDEMVKRAEEMNKRFNYSLILNALSHTGLKYEELVYFVESSQRIYKRNVELDGGWVSGESIMVYGKVYPLSKRGASALKELREMGTNMPTERSVQKALKKVGVAKLRDIKWSWAAWLLHVYGIGIFLKTVTPIYGINNIQKFYEDYEKGMVRIMEEENPLGVFKEMERRVEGWRESVAAWYGVALVRRYGDV